MRVGKLASLYLALVALAAGLAAAQTTVKIDTIEILESRTLPGNILPQFMFSQGSVEGGGSNVKIGGGKGQLRPFTPDDSCDEEIFEGANPDLRSPQLPYLSQDQWTCDLEPTKLPVVVLENEHLRANIAPSVAGKIWNTVDKKHGRDLFFNNRAHQPANIGALKAWAAGGCEFNWSPGIIGHSAFSESPVHVAALTTARGPVVRVYEFDRYNGTTWQVDIALRGDELWLHPRITNPTSVDLRGYWWTCVAHHVTPESRVVAPAAAVAETSSGPVRHAPWPYYAEVLNTTFSGLAPPLGANVWLQDHSFIGNVIWGDLFLRMPKALPKKWIMHVERDGYFVYHGVSQHLRGLKAFTWGQNGPSRFMQDFLSGFSMPNRGGDYAELQVGPAPTQMQTFAVPARSVVEWTEVFKAGADANIPTELLQHRDYDKAVDAVSRWLDADASAGGAGGIAAGVFAEMDAFFTQLAGGARPTREEVLFQGMPWGAVQELMLAETTGATEPLAPGLLFTLDERDADARAWIELVRDGNFSTQTLGEIPSSFQTTAQWQYLLEASAAKGATWLHDLHLGIVSTELGNVQQPLALFKSSLQKKPSAIAARNIALLQSAPEEAYRWLLLAWEYCFEYHSSDRSFLRLVLNLGNEITQFLQANAVGTDKTAYWVAELTKWVANELPRAPQQSGLAKADQVITARVKVLLTQGKSDEAQQILASNCFPTYGRARKELIAYWHEANFQKKQREVGGRDLTLWEKRQARQSNKPPRNIGCPYADTYCDSYW